MGDKTAISWTDATWNPVTGCTRVSAGCDNCYIDRSPPFRMNGRRFDGEGPGSTTGVLLHENRLDQPLRWRTPRRVFVNSLSDLFHPEIPVEFIADVFGVMALARQHTFQVLTKRPARMRSVVSDPDFVKAVAGSGWVSDEDYDRVLTGWPLPNVWLGTSTETQHWADIRVPALMNTPAAVHFVSAEPLLGPLDLRDHLTCGADWPTHVCTPGCRLGWVIVGGESGPRARPVDPVWVRDLRDQCVTADVPFFFKQWGGLHAKTGGRDLDGRVWDDTPPLTITGGADR
jgi:protein gp37